MIHIYRIASYFREGLIFKRLSNFVKLIPMKIFGTNVHMCYNTHWGCDVELNQMLLAIIM